MKKTFLFIGICLWAIQAKAVTFVTKPYLQSVQPTEATVMWLSSDNVGMYGWVEYMPSGGKKQKAYQMVDGARAMCNRINQVCLTNLQPNTTYSYRVYEVALTQVNRTSLKSGDTIVSDTYSFTTPALNASTTKCLFFNDLHSNPSFMTKMIGYNKLPDFEFVMFNGDILNMIDNETTILENMIKPCITSFATTKPFFTVKGNHEDNKQYISHYWEYFANPTSKSGYTKGYYSFSWGPCFFIVLDTGNDRDNTYGHMATLEDFDPYREEQAVWLEQQLQSDAKKNASFTFVCMHAPTYSNTSKEYHQSIHSRELFQPLFHKYGIDAMICGHTHIPELCPADDRHFYPMVIGGGYSTAAGDRDVPTIITLDATRYNAIITTYNYSGTQLNRLELVSKNLPDLSGNIVLARLGDSTATINAAKTCPVFLDEYTLQKRTATRTRSIPLPTTADGANHRCVAIGSSFTSSFLNLSADNRYMLFGGYDDAVGEKSATKTSNVVPRVVAVVDAEGHVNTTTAITNAYSAQEFRCVASADGSTLYLSGAGTADNPGGVYMVTLGDTLATRVSVSDHETRAIHYYNDLWVNNGTDLLLANSSFLPSGATISDPSSFTLVSLDDTGFQQVLYWIVSANEIAKYSLVEGTWVYNGTYTGLTKVKYLLARNTSDCIQLFVVNGLNSATGACKLMLFEDAAGYNKPASGLLTELIDVAGSRTTLRGLCWKPTPSTNLWSISSPSSSTSDARVLILPDGRICIQRGNQLYSITGNKIQ